MPTLTRCTSCGATVSPNTSWCSLCHTDLRPAPEPEPLVAAPVTIVPGADAPSGGRHRRDDDEPEPAPRRSRARAAAPSGGSGRHAVGRRERPTRAEAAVLAEGYVAHAALAEPRLEEPDPDRAEVERLAESMLLRLAVVEQRESLFNPDDLPGDRWGFAAAVALVVSLVLLIGSVVVNAIVNH